MTSVTTTIRRGINSSTAVKKPCKAATTANITLSGEQTIDGISCTEGDRVLVKDQTTGSENGIYAVDSSSWQREPDWDGTFDVVQGTYVFVAQGATNNNFWRVSTADPITIGTTSVTIISTDPDSLLRSNLADTSTGQGASLVGVEDSAGNFDGATIEAVLAEIISDYATVTNGNGASKIGVEDTASNFTATTVEAILAEIYTRLRTKGADLTTSDVTANILTVGTDGGYFDFTGTDTINGITTVRVGTVIRIHFDAAATLTHHATDFFLPGAANITTAAGDEAVFFEYAAGDWRCVNYSRLAAAPMSEFSEGTWTPTIQDTSFSDSESQTYIIQEGAYTKIGNRVFISGRLSITSLGSLTAGDAAYIAGLPYAGGGIATVIGSVSFGYAINLAIAAGTNVGGYIGSGDTYIKLSLWDATTGISGLLISEVSADGWLGFEGQYTV